MELQFVVELPADVYPGQTIGATAPDGQVVNVVVPDGCGAGSQISVAYVPLESTNLKAPIQNEPAADANAPQQFVIVLPEGSVAGQAIHATSPDGQIMSVIVPDGMVAGQEISIGYVPLATEVNPPAPEPVSQQEAEPQPQQFVVALPDGVVPGQMIQATAPDGQILSVLVPPGCGPGMQISVSFYPMDNYIPDYPLLPQEDTSNKKIVDDDPKICKKEFGYKRANKLPPVNHTLASKMEDWVMCGAFFQQINSFVEKYAQIFYDPNQYGGEHPLEWTPIFREYEAIISVRCEKFLVAEGVTAEFATQEFYRAELEGKKYKLFEYLYAAINYEMFIRLMLDFKMGKKDVSRWSELFENDDWTWYPAC